MHPPRRSAPHAALDEFTLPPHPDHTLHLCPGPRLRSHHHARRGLPTLSLLLAAALAAASLLAQSPADGALHGALRDASTNTLPHAAFTLRSLDTGEDRTSSTEADGTFLLPHLAPGSYLLLVSDGGFQSARYGPLTVTLGQTTELHEIFPLENLPPWVSADPERAQDPAAPQGNPPVTSSELGVLPSKAEGVQDLASDVLGALPDEDADGLLSVRGLASTQNSSLVDGVENTQSFNSVPMGSGNNPAPNADDDPDSADLTTGPGQGLARGRHAGASYTFPRAAIREFRVAGLGNSAEAYSTQIGRAAGGVATTVSRSGTRKLHGSGFFVLRSSLLAAHNPFAIATTYAHGIVTSEIRKPHDLRENFGATLGGPVPRTSHLLFFYAYDQQRRGFPAISSPADPNFYRLTPIQRALLGIRGVSPDAVDKALEYISSLTGPTDRRADQTIHFGKLDWQPRVRVGLGLDFNRVRWNSPAGLIDAPVVARGRASLGSARGSIDAVLLRSTAVFSAHTLNQVRLQYGRDLQYESAQPRLPQEPGIGPGGLAPEVNIGPNGLLFGTPASVARSAYPDERRIEIADSVTLIRGQHMLEFGGDLSFVHDRVASLNNAAGTFRYDSANARGFAGGLVDFITDYTFNVNTNPNGGCPNINAAVHLFCFRSFTQSFGTASVAFSTQEWAGFVEDTWRPRPGLTLHAGLRYEYTLLPVPDHPNGRLDAVFGVRGATSVFPEDRNNLGPRASVAYQPFGANGGTLELGYGLFFGRLAGSTIRSALINTAQPSSTTHVRFTPGAVVSCPQVPTQGFGYPCSFLAPLSNAIASTSSAVVFDRGFRLPLVQRGSVSFERELPGQTSLSAGYVINVDRQLESSTDLNIAPSTRKAIFQLHGGTGAPGIRDGETFAVPLYSARVDPNFGPVTAIVSHSNATYHALMLALNSRPSSSLQLRAHYLWSKAIDFGQNSSATPRTNGQFDPFTNGYDKGLSSLNYPWAVHFTAVWLPHVEAGQPWLRRLGSGWQAAPILAARSGRPYSFDLFGGTRLPGGHSSINGSGGALYLPTIGRNTLRLPPTFTCDLRVGRVFPLGAKLHARASVEAFNVLNHRNISSVVQRAYVVGTPVGDVTPLVFQDAATIAAEGLNTQPFGTPNSAGTHLARERQIQLTLHLDF